MPCVLLMSVVRPLQRNALTYALARASASEPSAGCCRIELSMVVAMLTGPDTGSSVSSYKSAVYSSVPNELAAQGNLLMIFDWVGRLGLVFFVLLALCRFSGGKS